MTERERGDAAATLIAPNPLIKVITAVDRGVDKVVSASGILAIVIMVLLSVFVFAVSVSRYVFRINLAGLFDLSVYSLTVFPFLSCAYTLRAGNHITVDMITAKLSKRTQAILNVAVFGASLLYTAVLGWNAWRLALNLLNRGVLTTAVLQIPKGILIALVTFGILLLLLQTIRVIVANIRKARSEAPSRPGLGDNAWFYIAVFVIGTMASIALFQVNGVAGIGLLAVVVLFSGMPVFLALGFIGVIGMYYLIGSSSFMQIPITASNAVASFTLTCLPLFILGGIIMEESGIVGDTFKFFELFLGRWAVSPLLVTIAAGMLFCAISGSSTATHAVIAAVALPVLFKGGYSKALACGVVAGSAVGTLIPPSIGYVVYGVITGESVGALFFGTILPAVVLFAFYVLYIVLLGKFSKKSLFEGGIIPPPVAHEKVTWKDRFGVFKNAVWGLLTPVILMGGLYLGIFTATETAAILVIYGLVISVAVKRMSWKKILQGTLKSALSSSMVMCIIFSAYVFALVISQMRAASGLVAYAQAVGMSDIMVLLIIFGALMILGCFLEGASMKVITLPLFYPLAMAVGINSVWLGVFYQFLAEIGGLTPPVGLNLFVIQAITGLPMNTVVKGSLPFIGFMVLTVVVTYFFPQLVLWLPSLMK